MANMKRAYAQLGGAVGASEFGEDVVVTAVAPRRKLDDSFSVYNRSISRATKGWKRGPIDAKGVLYQASERPLMCLAVSPLQSKTEAVVGSSDHALYTFDFSTGKRLRTLYSKRFGHQEWVTCVSYSFDGRVVSGGMDSKLCVWMGNRCDDLRGHTGSVSVLECGGTAKSADLVISGSYDRSIRVWSLKDKECVQKLGGSKRAHQGAVLALDWSCGGQLLSGARDGTTALWDLNSLSPTPIRTFSAPKSGHVTSVATFEKSAGAMRLSGHQDGCVRLWDARDRSAKAAMTAPAHRTESGKAGAVGSIVCSNARSELEHIGGNVVVTAGADGCIAVLDPRSSFKPCIRLAHHRDFIYSMRCIGPLVVSGGGDGNVLVHDLTNGKLLYGIAANQHAVRCISATPRYLITAGDDGSALSFEFGD